MCRFKSGDACVKDVIADGYYLKTGDGEYPYHEIGVVIHNYRPIERPTPGEFLQKYPHYDKIDDAVEAEDWRISITHDLKVGVLRWWQSVCSWFDMMTLRLR